MRRICWPAFVLIGIAVLVSSGLAAGAPSAEGTPGTARFETVYHAAMAPYYAALVASARGDREAAHRQTVLLEARWQPVARLGRTEAASALRDDPAWAAALAGVAADIEHARQCLVARDIVSAHADLESIRKALRDVRARHGLLTFDDRVTDYHDLMERLTGRIGGPNEIALTKMDFLAIRDAAADARTAWAALEGHAGAATLTRAWRDVANHTGAALGALERAAAADDATQLARHAEALKACYFDLLAVLARSGS